MPTEQTSSLTPMAEYLRCVRVTNIATSNHDSDGKDLPSSIFLGTDVITCIYRQVEMNEYTRIQLIVCLLSCLFVGTLFGGL